jgi:alkylhydroperoxidase family enzyme
MSEGRPVDRLRALQASIAQASTAKPDALLAAYLEKVKHAAATITDAEVAALQAAGHTQDAIFESTVATALEAAVERFDAGLRALDEATASGEPRR